MKIYYLTKYWESKGIVETAGVQKKFDEAVYISNPRSPFNLFERLGKTIFTTRKEAIADVEKKATARIVSLRRKADRIEKEWLCPISKP